LEDESDDFAKRLFWLVAQRLGTPVSQSAAGERLFAVQDAGFAESDRRARGPNTRKRLSFHTDRCDVIGFLCVRQALEGGQNDVVSSVTLFNRILVQRPDLCRTLMESYLYQRHNVDHGNALAYCEQPIFSITKGHFAANCLRVLIERAYASPETPDMTDLQREALDYLEATAEDETLFHRFRLERGDMLFLNNWVTLHRRLQFVDHPEPDHKRLLYRAWLSMPNSRPLDPRFAANYGSTEAGAVRGGMRAR
ncbi:MAG: TauD/TfdA family dioxygenase, partial [Planctomycetota bacterium]